MDVFGWFIASLHQFIGHDKTAAVIGQPPGDKSLCVLCRYERGEVHREAVLDALAPETEAVKET